MTRRSKADMEAMRLILKVERTRALRDVVMSAVQASAVNPMWSSFFGIAAGGALVGVHDIAKASKVSRDGLPNVRNVGYALAGLAGAKASGEVVEGVLKAWRGASTSQSIAFDIPDSEGAALLPGSVGPSFRSRRA